MANTRNHNNNNVENNNGENNQDINPPPPPLPTLELVTNVLDHAVDHGHMQAAQPQVPPPPPRDRLGDF
jgi:hypothetical protein